MRSSENYTRFYAAAVVLTLAILGSFQLYITGEPARIAADEQQDALVAVTAGRTLYADNCAMCHGQEGEGVDGPPLNDSGFLHNTANQTVFSLISSGVPGTEMPAWSQTHGGPFTDEQVRQLVAFIRSWEPDAPDRQAEAMAGDAANGLAIFNSTCVVCHGETGIGTERAPTLNDSARLAQFDDEWYVETISAGRPAQGMPTWGTVLAPEEIRDLVALLRAWQRGETVEGPGAAEAVAEAMHMLEHGDLHAAAHALEESMTSASGEVRAAMQATLEALEAGDVAAAEEAMHLLEEILHMETEHHED